VNCDVPVVGASSAGLMTATSAGEGGADVILAHADPRGTKHAANILFEGMARAAGINIDEHRGVLANSLCPMPHLLGK
jgi:predicted flavoprotein YhiN